MLRSGEVKKSRAGEQENPQGVGTCLRHVSPLPSYLQTTIIPTIKRSNGGAKEKPHFPESRAPGSGAFYCGNVTSGNRFI